MKKGKKRDKISWREKEQRTNNGTGLPGEPKPVSKEKA